MSVENFDKILINAGWNYVGKTVPKKREQWVNPHTLISEQRYKSKGMSYGVKSKEQKLEIRMDQLILTRHVDFASLYFFKRSPCPLSRYSFSLANRTYSQILKKSQSPCSYGGQQRNSQAPPRSSINTTMTQELARDKHFLFTNKWVDNLTVQLIRYALRP